MRCGPSYHVSNIRGPKTNLKLSRSRTLTWKFHRFTPQSHLKICRDSQSLTTFSWCVPFTPAHMGFLLVPSVCPNKLIWSRPITVTLSRTVPLLCRTTAYRLNFVSMVGAIWSVRHEGRVLLCIYYSLLRDYIAFSFHSHKKFIDRRGSSGTRSIIEYLTAMLTAQLGTIMKKVSKS